MKLEIQKFLRKDEQYALEHIADHLAIKVLTYNDGRVLFKYNQIKSPMDNIIVKESRGLILDRFNDWNVVSFPFTKFFNYGETHAADVDMSTARILEKVDGSCMSIYYFDNEWKVQTNGMADAEGMVGTLDISFAELFWRYFGTDFDLDVNYTYIFEMSSKYNRIVTKYDVPQIVLIGQRNLRTLNEEVPNLMGMPITVRLPKSYSADSLNEVKELADNLTDLSEGYVVVDDKFRRVKVKSPYYFAISKMKESLTASIGYIVEAAVKNEGSEFLSYFEEYTDEFNRIKNLVDAELDRVDRVWKNTKELETQKEFAMAVKDDRLSGLLFSMRKGVVDDARSVLLEMEKHKASVFKNFARVLNVKSKMVYVETSR